MSDPFGTPKQPDPFGIPRSAGRDYTDAEARAAQNLPLDQYGRYRIPSPDGIQPATNKGRTRVSTTKGVGQDQSRIAARTERLIVKGLAASPALAQRAAAALELEDDSKAQRKALAQIAAEAFVTAGGDDRRNQGTEVHQIIDDILKGLNPDIPEKYQRDVSAYFEALEKFGLEPVPGLSEIVVLAPYEHGGAIDNIMRWWNPDTEGYELVVVDTKTGRTLENSRVEFLSQTWMYSNALYAFVVTGMDRDKDGNVIAVRGYTEELPRELRRDKAIIIHLPMDGTAEAVLLDLSGWDRIVAAQVAIRQANAEAKYRYRSLGVIRPEAFIPPASNWVQRGQLGAVVVPTDGSVKQTPLANAVVPWAVETGNGADASGPSPIVAGLAAEQARVEAQADAYARETIGAPISVLADAITQGLVIETGHYAGTVAHKDQLTGERPIDMSAGQFNGPVTAAVENHQANDGRDPVTGRKKRTCGFCHKPGHTQKNCPDNPASAKYNPYPHAAGSPSVEPVLTSRELIDAGEFNDSDARPVPAGEPAPENNCNCQQDGDWHPYVRGMCNPAGPFAADSADGDDAPAPPIEAAPFCTLSHACQWTSQHPNAPGQWVCSVSGKPGKTAYENGATAVTNEAPFYGSPASAVPGASQAAMSEHAEPAAAWPPPSLLDLIGQAPTQSAVLALRQQHLEAGTWTAEHDAAGMARYQALAP